VRARSAPQDYGGRRRMPGWQNGGTVGVVLHAVEVRCASKIVDGSWRDVWVLSGDMHLTAEFANQAADKEIKNGFAARVRPVVCGP
jgi:hypothetical protein